MADDDRVSTRDAPDSSYDELRNARRKVFRETQARIHYAEN